MRACFIAETPYHIFNCIRIAKSIDMPKDLYLVNLFNDSDVLVKNIGSLHLFDKVYHIIDPPLHHSKIKNPVYDKIRIYLLTLFYYVFMDTYIKKKAPKLKTYTHLYNCHRLDFFPRVASLYLMKYKPNISFCYYDDGIGSYTDPSEMYIPKSIGKVFDYIISNGNSSRILYDIILNDPSFINNPDKLVKIRNISTINPFKRNEENDRIMKAVYGNNALNQNECTFLFLDTVKEELYTTQGRKKYIYIRNLINKIIGVNNIIYKPHPRDTDFDYSLPHFKNSNVPFEYYSYFNDLSDKVLITDCSSSAFMPKLLYNQEPTIIFLCAIMSKHLLNYIDMSVIDSLKKIYHNKAKILVPKNIKELIEIIGKLK